MQSSEKIIVFSKQSEGKGFSGFQLSVFRFATLTHLAMRMESVSDNVGTLRIQQEKDVKIDLGCFQKEYGPPQQDFHLDCSNAIKLTNTSERSTLKCKLLRTISRLLVELVQPQYQLQCLVLLSLTTPQRTSVKFYTFPLLGYWHQIIQLALSELHKYNNFLKLPSDPDSRK